MNKKVIIIIGVAILGFFALTNLKGPVKTEDTQNNVASNQNMQSFAVAQKVEVFMFHATQRCPTCIKIGQLTKATIEERFAEQLKSGKIDFREINVDLPENKILAEKFQASGSALFVNAITNGKDNIKEDVKVWQLAGGTSDKFKDYLSNKLNAILGI